MRRGFPARGGGRAFTLIEVIVSIVVLFFALLFTIQLLASGFQYYWRSKSKTTLVALAQDVMEDQIRTATGAVATSTWTVFDTTKYPGCDHYQYSIAVVTPFDSHANLQQVKVSVQGPMLDNGSVYPGRTMQVNLVSILVKGN